MAHTVDAGADPANCARMESSWAARDLACIWHPFTQAQTAAPPLPIVRGQGARLYSETGKSYLDASSSWWVNLHGHAHPYIAEKIAEQARELEHVLFAGFTHPQAIVLAERLLAILPEGYAKVFYSDNGSTAVETALKMCLQAVGPDKKLLSFRGGYHGDTFGAMSAAGKSFCNKPFWPYLFEIHSIDPPLFGKEEGSWRAFEEALETGKIGAFLFEPLIQGWGGIFRLHSPVVLRKMIEACQKRGILTLADEVMTGFGRTGTLFASDQLGVTPDLICLAKGITGGFLPLGATIVKQPIFDAFLSSDFSQAFLHGHSYSGNPLACAAANGSLDLLLNRECGEARARIEKQHRAFQKKWAVHPKLSRCEVLGTILILEYKTEESSYFHPLREQLLDFFQERGILLRPFGNILSLFPPYCITARELEDIYSAIAITLEEWP